MSVGEAVEMQVGQSGESCSPEPWGSGSCTSALSQPATGAAWTETGGAVWTKMRELYGPELGVYMDRDGGYMDRDGGCVNQSQGLCAQK